MPLKQEYLGCTTGYYWDQKKKIWFNEEVNGSGKEWDSVMNMIKTFYEIFKDLI